MDRRVGITRCRAPILLSCLCLDSCTRVQRSIVLEILERERERGESDHPRFLERVFFTTGAKGVSWRVDGRLSQPKWDSRVVGNLLCCCWRGDSDTRPKGNLFARETRAIDCNCVWIGYGDWLWQAGWRVDKFLIMGLLFSRFEGFVGYSGKYWESCDLASGELFIRRNLVQIYKYISRNSYCCKILFDIVWFVLFFLLEISKFREGMRLIDFILFIS